MTSKTPFDHFEIEPLPQGMAHWREAFSSRFLRVLDLRNKPHLVTIDSVATLKSSNKKESKCQLLITLREFEKPWAINVTNSETIALLYANDDPNSWIGKRITLYPTKTKFGRDMVDCIRVREQIPTETAEHMSTKAAVRQAANMPPKPQRSPKVTELLQTMADCTMPEQLDGVEETLTEANDLSREDTQFLVQQLTRRRSQLGAAESK